MIKAFGTMVFLPAGLDSWRIIIRSVDAAQVKQLAKDLGADLVGVASAATLNAHPPDPKWPQTPERISPYVKSVIVVAQRIPAGDDDDALHVGRDALRSEEHTSELQSRGHLVCRLLLEKKKTRRTET